MRALYTFTNVVYAFVVIHWLQPVPPLHHLHDRRQGLGWAAGPAECWSSGWPVGSGVSGSPVACMCTRVDAKEGRRSCKWLNEGVRVSSAIGEEDWEGAGKGSDADRCELRFWWTLRILMADETLCIMNKPLSKDISWRDSPSWKHMTLSLKSVVVYGWDVGEEELAGVMLLQWLVAYVPADGSQRKGLQLN